MKQQLLRTTLAAMTALVLSAASALATTFYVDAANGNDANTGLTWAQAKQTIQAAVNAAASTDNIKIAGGAAAVAVYNERVVVDEKTLTLEGRQDNANTGANESSFATIIRPSTNATSHTEATLLNWSGLPSTSFDAVVYGRFSVASYSLNIYGITIDANQLGLNTRLCTGLAIKEGNGTIGDASRPVDVMGAREATMTAYNGGYGVVIFGKSQAWLQYVKVTNYQTAGVLVAGNSTSNIASTIASQPKPTLYGCILEGQNRPFSGSYIAGVMSVNGGRGIMKRTLTYRNYNNTTHAGGAERLSYGYGVYLSDSREWTVGDLTQKTHGNVITENEIGVFVEMTTAGPTLTVGLYQIRQNNIYRNGYNGTATSSTGQYFNPCTCAYQTTTRGNVRFRNTITTGATSLNMSSNSWGNADASAVFTKLGNGTVNYTPANYDATSAALWQETIGDYISVTSALASSTILFNPSYVPITGSTVNLEYGYSQFPSLNDAVAAASALTEATVSVPVGTHVLNEPLVITKKINVAGAAVCTDTPAGSMATLQLATGVCGPTIWVQGMSTTVGDPLTRTPDDVDITDLYILPRNGGGTPAMFNWGFAFTGANAAGLNSPTNTQVKGVKMSTGFTGGLHAMVTDMDVVANGACERISSGATSSNRDIDAKITYVGDCDVTSLLAADVYDDADEPGVIARIIYDNTMFVSTCAELQTALDLAATDPVANTPMSIVATAAITNCTANYNVNGGGTVQLASQGAGSLTFDQNYPININSGINTTTIFAGSEATWPGGTAQACNLTIGSGTVTVGRVNVWPPACLQNAVNVVTAGNTNTVYAAQDNSTTTPLAFVEGSGLVTIAKNFDFHGADNIMNATGNATFTGKFVLNTGADVPVASGTVRSTRGAAFADGSDQVDVNFTSATLANFGGGTGEAIEMGLQFIGTTGSRGLNLTQASYAAETPLLNKRVHLHGLASRGSATGTITLNGSGNCANPSLIQNVNVATIVVNSDADCIQTALGTAGAAQATEGVGTNSANGSGGTINLNSVDYTQAIDVGKSVTFTNETESSPLDNGTVTLRRGAAVTGMTDWSNIVLLTQAASWTGAANPDPQQGVSIVNTNGALLIAGYGRGTGVGTGADVGGPWAFNNINITKPCVVAGHWGGTCANAPANCTAADPNVVPPMSAGRGDASETVIGFNSAGGYDPTGNPIFLIGANNVTLRGFYFDNVRGTADRYVITSNAGGFNTCTVSNNILDGTGGGANQYGFLGMHTTLARADWTISCNRMFGANSGINIATNRGTFVNWLNNNASSRSATAGTVIFNNVVLVDNGGDLIGLTDINNGANDSYLQVTDNFLSTNAAGGPVSGGCIMFRQLGADRAQGVQMLRNVTLKHDAGVYFPLGDFSAANTNATVANNFITQNGRGVWIEGVAAYTAAASINRIRANNNFLASNTISGAEILSGVGGGTTGKVEIGSNWWGGAANLGPARGSNVTTAVQPFASANGNQIQQNAVGAGDVFTTVLPFFISATDQNLVDCGWTGGPMIGPVLRMATGGTSLLGVYPTITNARDNTSCAAGFTCSPTRTNTDEIWVIGENGGAPSATLYPSATSPEPLGYPVVFNNNDAGVQPSTVLGINQAIIRHTDAGAIQTTTRTNGFTVRDLTFNDAGATAVGRNAVWLNSGNATINGCTFNSAATTIGASYTAIRVEGTGTSAVNIGNTTANTIAYTGTVSAAGINVLSGFNSGTVARNTITGIFGTAPVQMTGAGIYVGPGNSGITVGGGGVGNTIQGSASNGSNGIVLDATSSTITVNSNSIATTTALRSTNTTGISAGGFGILVYANNGTSAIGNVSITNNIIGGTTGAGSVDQAGIFVGGTTGAIGGITIGNSGAGGNTIRGVRDGVGTAAASNAAVAIATFGGTPASGQVDVTWNTIGGTGAGEGNKVDLLIGSGASANNLSVQVQSNNFRDDAQVIDGSDVAVRDNRTAAGTNIRNIFGNPNGTTNTGPVTAGQGQSGNNTFSHAAILTSSTNLQDYGSAAVRTANAVAVGGVTAIFRRIATPMASANNTDNTVEVRETAGFAIGNANTYFAEQIVMPDFRIMLLGPTNSPGGTADVLAGAAGTGTALSASGRENRDVRGAIRFNTIGAGLHGQIPAGAANKGDVYLQLGSTIGIDPPVTFRYDAAALASLTAVAGLANGTTKATDIKAGIDDADDDNYTANTSAARRTGVFRSGTATQFTKPNDGPLTGDATGVFPNPTTGDAALRYAIPADGAVTVSIFNALGIKVAEFVPGAQAAGTYTIDLTTDALPSGAYTVRVMNAVAGYGEPMTQTVPLQVVR